MGLSAFYKTPLPDDACLKVLDAVYESGCSNWDIADAYQDNEELLGKWFKRTGQRNKIFLATKFGLFSGVPGKVSNGEPESVHEAFAKSPCCLGVDYVELYYFHRIDPTVPIEKTVSAMADLVKAGKVRYLGLSEPSAETLRQAHAVHPITAIQVEYSLFTLDIEDEKVALLKTARELRVAIFAYSPLGRGLLTGQITSPDEFPDCDVRRSLLRFSLENFLNILKLVGEIKKIADRHNAAPDQVAITWLLAQGSDIIPIPGTTSIPRLKENLGAVNVTLVPRD